MRQSIGTVTLLNFIIVFIFIIFAFLMGTFSYYKAYKVNNYMLAAIEKYEGFNELSFEEIENKLASLGYEELPIKCAKKSKAKAGTKKGDAVQGILVDYKGDRDKNVSDPSYQGYCVYMYKNDGIYQNVKKNGPATTDRYDTYEVVTYLSFNMPVLNSFLHMTVSSKTGRIFYFGE